MILAEILVPLLNANEPEARLASLHVKDAQAVEKGMILFTVGTTKAASELETPVSGYVRLLAKAGDMLEVGDRLAVITSSPFESLDALASQKAQEKNAAGAEKQPAGLRITK